MFTSVRRIVAVIAVFAVVFSGSQVFGQQSQGLRIGTSLDLEIAAGKTYDGTLTVGNPSTTTELSLSLRVIDFDPTGSETGDPGLITDVNAEQTPWSLQDYIDVPQVITIAPGENLDVPFTISIPEDIGAGSYYSAVQYFAGTPDDPERLNLNASGVTLVFVNVPGETTELLTLRQFGAYSLADPAINSQGGFRSWYFGDRPNALAFRLENEGSVAGDPEGSLVVKNMSGESVVTVDDINPNDLLTLRGQTRRYEVCLNPEDRTVTGAKGNDISETVCAPADLSPGRYTAELTLYYITNNNITREIAAKTTFYYVPFWLVALIVLVVTALIWAGYYLQRKLGKKRK